MTRTCQVPVKGGPARAYAISATVRRPYAGKVDAGIRREPAHLRGPHKLHVDVEVVLFLAVPRERDLTTVRRKRAPILRAVHRGEGDNAHRWRGGRSRGSTQPGAGQRHNDNARNSDDDQAARPPLKPRRMALLCSAVGPPRAFHSSAALSAPPRVRPEGSRLVQSADSHSSGWSR